MPPTWVDPGLAPVMMIGGLAGGVLVGVGVGVSVGVLVGVLVAQPQTSKPTAAHVPSGMQSSSVLHGDWSLPPPLQRPVVELLSTVHVSPSGQGSKAHWPAITVEKQLNAVGMGVGISGGVVVGVGVGVSVAGVSVGVLTAQAQKSKPIRAQVPSGQSWSLLHPTWSLGPPLQRPPAGELLNTTQDSPSGHGNREHWPAITVEKQLNGVGIGVGVSVAATG